MTMVARFLCTVAALGGVVGCGGGNGTDADADSDVDSDSDTDSGTGSDSDTVPSDADGDGFLDTEEVDCGSDPDDVASTCYACGWKRGDPGDLVATGAAEGDTIENMTVVDQCGSEVPLWDFAGEYHVLFLTAAW